MLSVGDGIAIAGIWLGLGMSHMVHSAGQHQSFISAAAVTLLIVFLSLTRKKDPIPTAPPTGLPKGPS